jgi:tRNA(Ile2) C34 agmatinyltransferase TiaS
MRVKTVCAYKWGAEFPQCPRCGTTMEREYQLFCGRCGQRLNWSRFDECEVRHTGWDGPEEDEESDAGGEQVDDGDQEDTTRID